MQKVVNMIKAAYIKIYGEEKWNSLTDRQKHDVIMIIAKDLSKTIDNL